MHSEPRAQDHWFHLPSGHKDSSHQRAELASRASARHAMQISDPQRTGSQWDGGEIGTSQARTVAKSAQQRGKQSRTISEPSSQRAADRSGAILGEPARTTAAISPPSGPQARSPGSRARKCNQKKVPVASRARQAVSIRPPSGPLSKVIMSRSRRLSHKTARCRRREWSSQRRKYPPTQWAHRAGLQRA